MYYMFTLVASGVCIAIGLLSRPLISPAKLSPIQFFKVLALFVLAGGFAGFAAGFFGPILLAPGANQGPLLGIFFTGPLGAITGLFVFWTYEFRKKRSQQRPERD